MCVGEKDGEEQWLKVLRWIESEEVGNKKQVNDRREKWKRQLRGSALSSQLLWFKWADSTQISQHLTAVRHAFPFLFLTWTLILGCWVIGIDQPIVSETLHVWFHVFGCACARGVCLLCVFGWLYRHMPVYVSAWVSLPDQSRAPFRKASGVCSASNHARCDKFKNSLHVWHPALAEQYLLTPWVCL